VFGVGAPGYLRDEANLSQSRTFACFNSFRSLRIQHAVQVIDLDDLAVFERTYAQLWPALA
jgi:hypothetical protein